MTLGGDSELETHTSASKVISHVVNEAVKIFPPQQRAHRSDGAIGYWDYIKVIFSWSMEGDPLSYDDCAILLDHLNVLLPNVNHPIYGRISQAGMVKIRFAMRKIPQEPLKLQSGSLTLRAMLYPSRSLPPPGVRITLARARQMVEAQDLDNLVLPPVSEEFTAKDVYFAIKLQKQEGEASYPQYKYREIRNLLAQLQAELDLRNRWCASLGKIEYEDEEMEDKLVGSIHLEEVLSPRKAYSLSSN